MNIELKKVTVENLYETIHTFVQQKEMIVEDYDSMIEVILAMIKGGYCFKTGFGDGQYDYTVGRVNRKVVQFIMRFIP